MIPPVVVNCLFDFFKNMRQHWLGTGCKKLAKHSQKDKNIILFTGIFLLLLFVFIAGWLTVRMLDLSKGLDQIAGFGDLEAKNPAPLPSSSRTVITKKVPPPPTPSLPGKISETAAAPPQVPSTLYPEPVDSPQQSEEIKLEAPADRPEPDQTESKPPNIQTVQPQGMIPSPGGSGITATGPSTKPFAKTGERFSVQVGAFRVKEFALERTSILKALGYDPHIFSTADAKGHTWHTVRIGKFRTLEKAKQVVSAFKQKSDFPAAIMRVNSLQPALKS